MADGTIIRRIEAPDRGPVANGYRFGIQTLPVGNKPAMHVFGSFDEINKIALDIKNSPDKVFQTLRPLAPSPTGTFYLNDKPPAMIQNPLESISQNQVDATKLYPTQGSENRPLDRQQMEKKAFKDHMNEVAPQPEAPVNTLIGGE